MIKVGRKAIIYGENVIVWSVELTKENAKKLISVAYEVNFAIDEKGKDIFDELKK